MPLRNKPLSRFLGFLCLVFFCALHGPASHAQDNKPILSLNLPGHTARVGKVLFTPDGKELVSIGDDKVVRVWNAETGDLLHTLRGQIGNGPIGELYAAALSPDGRTLAIGGYLHSPDGPAFYVRLLDPNTGQVKRLLSDLQQPSLCLAFSPDGSHLASGDGAGALRINDLQSGNGYSLKVHTKDIYGVAFSPSGQQVATASLDGTVRLWDLGSRRSRALAGKIPLGYRCLAWSPDGRWIAGGGLDSTIHIWDGTNGAPRLTLTQEKYVNCLAFSPNSAMLAAGLGSDDPKLCDVRLWAIGPDGVSKTPVGDFPHHTWTVESVAFSPDGGTVASAGGVANDIYLWTQDGARVKQHMVSTGGVTQDVAWSPDSTQVTWHNQTAAAPVQNTFNIAERSLSVNPDGVWQGATLSRGGATLSLGVDHKTVQVSSGGAIRSNDPHNQVQCFTWTPDGNIAVGWHFGLVLYRHDGTPLRKFVGHTEDVTSVSASPDGKYLASTSSDQTVRIWPLSEDAASPDGSVLPLLSLFVGSDREWVAWTHSGFYTCSANGENIIGWQINQGDEQAAEFYPASRFHATFFRDDILGHLLEGGSEDQAIALADKGRALKTDLSRTVATLASFAPPTVQIVSPADGATVADAQVTVRVRITDPNHRPLSGLKLTDNERAVPPPDGGPPSPQEGEMTLSAALQPGDNTLSVVVSNDAGATSVPATVKLTYGAKAPVRPGTPTLYMMSIGVSKYFDSSVSLQYAAKDAGDIADFFQSQQGPGRMFSKVVVSKLLDRKADRVAIINSLVALRKQAAQMGPNDYTIVFVAGHGANDDDDQYFFAPYDIDPDNIDATGVQWLSFSEALAKLPGKVILMLDTCHSAAVEGKIDKKDGYGRFLVASTLDRLNNESPVITFASCGKGEESQESPVWNNGAFTKTLIEGLSGKADLNHDGLVSVSELSQYLKTRVSDLTKQAQRPELTKPTSIPGDLPLAVVGPIVTHAAAASSGHTLLAKTP